jgi:hypothetical protein
MVIINKGKQQKLAILLHSVGRCGVLLVRHYILAKKLVMIGGIRVVDISMGIFAEVLQRSSGRCNRFTTRVWRCWHVAPVIQHNSIAASAAWGLEPFFCFFYRTSALRNGLGPKCMEPGSITAPASTSGVWDRDPSQMD